MKNMTRRELLKVSAVGLAASFIPKTHLFADAPSFELLETKLLSRQPDIYYGWPTVGVTKEGELLVAVSGGRQSHVCPFGRVDLFRSRDGGATWTWPQTIYDGPTDDRDAGILVTDKGSILVSTFTSNAYADQLNAEMARRAKGENKFSDEQFEKWMSVHQRLTDEERKAELGCWLLRSTDGGVNWDARRRVAVSSPHGPIQLTDGRLLYPGCELWTDQRRVSVWESTDDGVSWQFLSQIPARGGDDHQQYHELHGVEASDGTLVVQIRNHNKANNQETLQTESADGGRTWSEPHPIGVWGLPSHLLRLQDGRLLMTYGHRRNPFGNQARLSSDNGKSWSDPILLSGSDKGRDLGYPSTVQLVDGTLISVWYEQPEPNQNAAVVMAKWRL